ncbi:MAG: methyl-accepting chemotaxis protein [Pseudomonadota bacterium]
MKSTQSPSTLEASSTLDQLRVRSISKLALGQFAHPPFFLLTGFAVGGDVLFTVLLSLLIGAAGLFVTRRSADSLYARCTIAACYMLQAALLVYLFSGHPWQLDAHMYFFAALAITTALFDWRALLVSAAVAAVHHLILYIALPAWVFPGESSFLRVIAHAVIVIVETGALVWLSLKLEEALNGADRLTGEASNAAQKAKLAERKAEESQRIAESLADEAKQEALKATEAEEAAQAAQAKAVADAALAAQAEQKAIESERVLSDQTRAQVEMVDTLASALQRLAKGDLSVSIDTSFEATYESLRIDFNKSVQGLRDTVSAIIEKSSRLDSAMISLGQSAGDLSRRTENQAATLENSAAVLSEVTQAISGVTQTVSDAENLIANTRSYTENSVSIMSGTVDTMRRIEKASQEMTTIISSIDAIAFQTNLLALNAGVEAARAGDAGRGFAVVASEVRALAQRASDSAKDIKHLIERNGAEIRSGASQLSETEAAIMQIAESINSFQSTFDSIATSSKDQDAALQSLNASISELDMITQQNAGMAQNSLEATESIAVETSALNSVTKRFSLDDRLTSAAAA